jgi:hypothetical protein
VVPHPTLLPQSFFPEPSIRHCNSMDLDACVQAEFARPPLLGGVFYPCLSTVARGLPPDEVGISAPWTRDYGIAAERHPVVLLVVASTNAPY